LVTGEASRLSQLGRTYERRGPAAHFNWLVLAIPLNHALVSGDDRVPRKRELRLYANGAVRVFLAAYAMP
jgi:hypothetical protein